MVYLNKTKMIITEDILMKMKKTIAEDVILTKFRKLKKIKNTIKNKLKKFKQKQIRLE